LLLAFFLYCRGTAIADFSEQLALFRSFWTVSEPFVGEFPYPGTGSHVPQVQGSESQSAENPDSMGRNWNLRGHLDLTWDICVPNTKPANRPLLIGR